MSVKRAPHKLSPASLRLVEELRNAPLLMRVGESIDRRNAKKAVDWRDALKRCLSKRWYNARIDWRNHLTEQLSKNFRDEYQSWNDIAHAGTRLLDPIVENAIAGLDERLGIRRLARKELFYSVRIDLGHALHEIEYDHLVSVKFYRSLLTWYLDGHMPCDCEGDSLAGRLVVF